MLDIKTGKNLTRRDLLKYASITIGGAALSASGEQFWLPREDWCRTNSAGSANASVGGMMRNVGARQAAMFVGKLYDEEIEYLESNGNQYIDTGICANFYTEVYTRCSWVSLADDSAVISMDNGSAKDNSFTIEYAAYDFKCILHTFDNSEKFQKSTVYPNLLQIYVITASRYGIAVNDGIIRSGGPFSQFQSEYPMLMFTYGRKGNPIQAAMSYIRIYELKISNNSNPQRHFVPVLKNGIPCMYDRIEGGFFYNQNSGHQFGYKKKDGTIVAPY